MEVAPREPLLDQRHPPIHPTAPPPVPSYSPNPQFSPFLFRLEQATSASLRVLVFLRKHQILARFPDAVSSSSYQLLSDHKTRPEQSSPQNALLSPKWADRNLSFPFFSYKRQPGREVPFSRFACWLIFGWDRDGKKKSTYGLQNFWTKCPWRPYFSRGLPKAHTQGTGTNDKLSSRAG